MIDYRSDNTGRAAPEILEALARANQGSALGYGGDDWTARLQQRYSELFETKVRVFPVATGTAANALSLAAVSPSWGLVYCSEVAHINTSEANAAGFFGGGLKLVPVAGAHGRINPEALRETLAAIQPGQPHRRWHRRIARAAPRRAGRGQRAVSRNLQRRDGRTRSRWLSVLPPQPDLGPLRLPLGCERCRSRRAGRRPAPPLHLPGAGGGIVARLFPARLDMLLAVGRRRRAFAALRRRQPHRAQILVEI